MDADISAYESSRDYLEHFGLEPPSGLSTPNL